MEFHLTALFLFVDMSVIFGHLRRVFEAKDLHTFETHFAAMCDVGCSGPRGGGGGCIGKFLSTEPLFFSGINGNLYYRNDRH